MKYRIIVLAIVLSFQTFIYAQKPKLNGFYKFDFGISYAKAKDIIKEVGGIDNDGFNSHTRLDKDEVFYIGGIDNDGFNSNEFLTWSTSSFANHSLFALSKGITLKFHKNQFYSVEVPFSGAFNKFDEIKSEITSKYFPCDISRPNYCKWIFSNGDYIELQFTTYGDDEMARRIYSQATMTYMNKSLNNLEKSDKTKENMKYF